MSPEEARGDCFEMRSNIQNQPFEEMSINELSNPTILLSGQQTRPRHGESQLSGLQKRRKSFSKLKTEMPPTSSNYAKFKENFNGVTGTGKTQL